MRNLLLLFVSLIFVSSCGIKEKLQPMSTVSGEVFVVTKGAGNMKLALVDVKAIPSQIFYSALESRKQEVQSAIQQRFKNANDCNDLINKFRAGQKVAEGTEALMTRCVGVFREYEALPEILMQKLPAETQSSTSNSEGKFSFKLPQNTKYVILGKGRRSVGDKEENYYWLQDVEINSETTNVMLSNNNLMQPDMTRLAYGGK